jgi:hypothetical protein
MAKQFIVNIDFQAASIEGSGIGRDFTFQIRVAGLSARTQVSIGANQTRIVAKGVASVSYFADPDTSIQLPVSVTAIEMDPRFNDSAVITGTLSFPLRGGAYDVPVSGNIRASGGDEPVVVTLRFTFRVTVAEDKTSGAGIEGNGSDGQTVVRKRLEVRLAPPGSPGWSLAGIDPKVFERIRQATNTLRDGARELASDEGIQQQADTLPPGVRDAIRRLADQNFLPPLEGEDGPLILPPGPLPEIPDKIPRIPGLDKMDRALRELNRIRGDYVAGLRPQVVSRSRNLVIAIQGIEPQDQGLPIQVSVENRLQGRINTPVVTNIKVAEVTLNGKALNPGQVINDLRDFPAPGSGILAGNYTLVGNYGQLVVSATFRDNRREFFIDTQGITYEGFFEEEARQLEQQRNSREAERINSYDKVVDTVLGFLTIVNALIDALSTAAAAGAAIPVIGGFLAGLSETTINTVENITQGLQGGLQIQWSFILRDLTSANQRANEENLANAEMFPESGPAGSREVIH